MPDMTQRDDAQPGDLTISPEDQRLLDGLIEAGMDRARLPHTLGRALTPQDQGRLDALTRLLTSLDDYPVEDVEPALLHATLARIDRH